MGDFALDTQSAELSHDGKRIRLPDQPFQILRLLISRRDEVITREELHQQLWPADTFVDFDRGLNSAMKKLRDALGDSAENPTYIETLPRRGYRLIAPVAEETTPTAVEPRRVQPWIWAIAAIVVVAAVAAVVALRFRATTSIRSIAILPLANLSGDPKEEYFADGMTEALITDLAQLKEVRVISRTSVMRYKQTKLSLPEIAKQLDVDGVIEGGVVHSGDRVRVTVQLIAAKTDQHIWAHAYEGEMKDVVTLQRDLSSAISNAIHAELTPHRAARVNPEAYELFLRGRVAYGKETAGGIKDAITYFQQAVAIEPDFAPGYAALANALSEQAFTGSVGAGASFIPAKQAALKALALDPQLAEAHAALGRILYRYEWNWAGSEEEYRRALALNPNDAQTHIAYATLLRLLHRDADANAETERHRAIHPLFAGTADGTLAKAFRYRKAGDYPGAIAELNKAVQMDPTVPRLHFQLGLTLAEAGRLNEGIAELERAVQLSPNNARFRARLAAAYATAGDQARARAILADLEKRSTQTFVSPAAMAVVHIALHENAQALDLLDRAYRERDFELINLIGSSNTFTPLKSEPRFRELMQKLRLPEA